MIDADNIDYNEIKALIKDRTRRHCDPGKPSASIPIPGQGVLAEDLVSFEDELFGELQKQHTSINDFVKSKMGEVKGKLGRLTRRFLRLTEEYPATTQGRVPLQQAASFSKFEDSILKALGVLQSLARFTRLQQQGFDKLLKKYQKWTESRALGPKFRAKVLNQQGSFTRLDFRPLLHEYANLLAHVRAPFEGSSIWQESEHTTKGTKGNANRHNVDQSHQENSTISRDFQPQLPHNGATELHAVFANGSDVDVDTALATLPLGEDGGRATYWVHSDNLLEMHILLLKYTRLWRSKDYIASCQSSAKPSRQGSPNGSSHDTAFLVQDEIENIVCDDLNQFVQRQNASTIATLEARASSGQDNTATNIRYSLTGEAIVTIGAKISTEAASTADGTSNRTKIKRKSLRQLFSSESDLSLSRSNSGGSDSSPQSKTQQDQDFRRVREWLQSHQNVQPLVQLTCHRTRFVDLCHGRKEGIWAILDNNVLMKKTSLDDLNRFKSGKEPESNGNSSPFPHAVLEIRWEGGLGKKLVEALDKSHLVSPQ